MDTLDKNELSRLIIESLEGTITSERLSRLDQLLSQHHEAVEYYVRHLRIYSFFVEREGILLGSNIINEADIPNIEMWEELAEYEKTAPEIKIPQEQPQRELIQKVVYPPREKRHLSKFQIFTLIMSAAAMLFFVLFLKFAPSKHNIEVATLSSSFNAKWADMNSSIQKGTRFVTNNEKLLLHEGFAELLFDNNARVTIEAPTEFQVLADDRIGLTYGKIYTVVSPDAIGFSVYTQNAKIVDMGTEFGVLADSEKTELHVMRGKTLLMPGSGKTFSNQYDVRQGQAKIITQQIRQGQARMVVRDGEVKDILLKKEGFVRKFDSKSHILWKGQRLDLSDIVGGGNGFGTGRSDTGIEYTGQTAVLDTFESQIGPAGYIPVRSNSFIDGIFVPDGGNGPVVISTQGHMFEQCPDTNGKFWGGILNKTQHFSPQVEIPWHNLRLGSKVYDGKQNKAIYMHANQGITFDLEAIRQMIPDISVSRFEAICGISDTLKDYKDQLLVFNYQSSKWAKIAPEDTKADFYVLVDGKLRFSKIDMTVQDAPAVLSVEIFPEDRFLTLVTTQGSNDEWGNSNDWTLFAEPVLLIEK